MVRVAGVFLLFPTRPLIPYKFLECLRPQKPARGRGRHQPLDQRLEALPSSPTSALTGQVPGIKQWLLSVISFTGLPASCLHPKSEILLHQCWGRSSTYGGMPKHPKHPIPFPKAHTALRLQEAGRTSAHNPHHVPKATRPPPQCSQLQLSPTPPGVNPHTGSWTQRFIEPFPKSRGLSKPRPNQREGSR